MMRPFTQKRGTWWREYNERKDKKEIYASLMGYVFRDDGWVKMVNSLILLDDRCFRGKYWWHNDLIL